MFLNNINFNCALLLQSKTNKSKHYINF